jgi:hypothetical protein
MAQQAFVLWFADDGNTNLADLNALLGQGWSVRDAVALSGSGEQGPETPQSPFPYSRALVLLEDTAAAQRAFVLWFADDGDTNLANLNALLGAGRVVVRMSSMSGTGEHGGETPQSPFPYGRALVVLTPA